MKMEIEQGVSYKYLADRHDLRYSKFDVPCSVLFYKFDFGAQTTSNKEH